MTQSQATDCINQIDIAQRKIAEYNTNWTNWDREYNRLDTDIVNKEIEIEREDVSFYQWILSELQNNNTGHQTNGQYHTTNGCGNWPSGSCDSLCKGLSGRWNTPRSRGPSSVGHYHTHMENCSWTQARHDTYRCFCIGIKDWDGWHSKKTHIETLITQKTTLQNTINQHARDMPKFPPIQVFCCDKTITCDNKIYGPNSCFGNLQICKQSNFNILDKSRTTELEINNKAKILKIQKDLDPISNQIKELLNSIYNLSRNLSSLIDNNSISNSILNIKKNYDQISVLMTKIETIKNINNVENEAKELFDYITTDTTHKREMQSIFESISIEVKNIKNIITQAKNTFSNIKIIYETLINEDLNINLLKVEHNKISKSISSLNNYLDNLEILYNSVNSLTISTQEDINKFLEIYNKSVVLVKNINLEIKDLNLFKNELTNIFNKFTINSFFINDVKLIYNESINNINNITRKINEININTIIENINSIFLKKKKLYESEIIRFDEEKLKIIQDEEKLKIIQNEIINNLKNIDDKKIDDKKIDDIKIDDIKIDDIKIDDIKIINYNNDIKQEETPGINIIYIVVIVIFIITILFLYIKK